MQSLLRSVTVKRPLACLLVVPLLVGCSDPGPPRPDGGAKEPWKPAFDPSSVGWLLDVCSVPGSRELWAVGGTTAQGGLLRYDGAAWSKVPVAPGTPLLNWCHATAANDVMFVGSKGTALRWDGATMTSLPVPTTQDLWGVWGAAAGDRWAVGGAGMKDGDATILHWDGVAWTPSPVPPLKRARVYQFLKVWGTAADDVYVVGQRGVVLRWDGAAWTELFVGASDDLVSLWGTGPNRIVAVGGRANGIVSTWDGTSWHTENLAPLPGLNGVWMRSPDVIHVAGNYGTLATVDFATRKVVDQPPAPTRLDFHAVHGDAAGRLWAVGGNLASANPSTFEGLAYVRALTPGE